MMSLIAATPTVMMMMMMMVVVAATITLNAIKCTTRNCSNNTRRHLGNYKARFYNL